ncbi:MAG: sulfatase [Candidatus Poribacteria bacterium]|jgi:arylsulfatase A-like enzyme|nr:sulfatase [Candidatus Poribacteria bacterium]
MNAPNVLWIFIEDMNDWMGCYGHRVVPTPHIDRLAEAGVRFDRAYMPAGVCSPSRSAVITGMYQTTIGAHNHRSSRPDFRGTGMGEDYDSIPLPDGVSTIPELFRQSGYYTFIEGKTDYNFAYQSADLYDSDNGQMGFKGTRAGRDWSGCPEGKPFFGQVQLTGGKQFGNPNLQRHVDPSTVDVPSYYPDHPIIRDEIALHYDCVRHTDHEVGQILSKLEEDGLLDNTIIFLFSDHGMRLPRHKQFIYQGGHKVPLIISGASDCLKPETIRPDLVSGIDISATSLALAGVEIPDQMEGQHLFADNFTPRQFVVAAKDRCDYTIDRIRTVRTQKYGYLRNFMTDRPYMQPQYRDGSNFMTLLRQMYAQRQLNEIQAAFWGTDRPDEELYDLEADPHETINLADDPAYAEVLVEHRQILENWVEETDDQGQYPESDAGLRCVLKRWGDKCVNPEYARLKDRS